MIELFVILKQLIQKIILNFPFKSQHTVRS